MVSVFVFSLKNKGNPAENIVKILPKVVDGGYVLVYNISILKGNFEGGDIMCNELHHKVSGGSKILFNIVMCPRYLRKIFDISGVEFRFRMLMAEIAKDNGYEISELYCGPNYVYLRICVPPSVSPNNVVNAIKAGTSSALISEFKELSRIPNLWTRNYYVTTAEKVSNTAIQAYVNSQKRDRAGERKNKHRHGKVVS